MPRFGWPRFNKSTPTVRAMVLACTVFLPFALKKHCETFFWPFQKQLFENVFRRDNFRAVYIGYK